VDARKSRLAQTHLIRYVPKTRDLFCPKRSNQRNLDIGYPSSLEFPFLIKIQKHILEEKG